MVSDTFILSHFHFLNIVPRMEAERIPVSSVLTKWLGKIQLNNMAELKSGPLVIIQNRYAWNPF